MCGVCGVYCVCGVCMVCVVCVYHSVVSVWVYVTGAVCVCACFWARGDVRRHRHCAVAVRSTPSLRKTTHPVPLFLSPLGVDRQASRDTALRREVLLLYRQAPVVLTGHGPPSRVVSEAPSGERCGQSRTQHLCTMPTILSHRIFVLCPPYSSPPHVEWSMIRFLIKLYILPPSRAKLMFQRT